MTEEGDGGRRKRIDLNVSQLVGGGAATMAAATAASYMGVYGTVIGAAVMSVISTAGTAVAVHLLNQSREKARGLAGRGGARSSSADPARQDTGSGSTAGSGAADGGTRPAAADDDAAPAGGDRGAPVDETRALHLPAATPPGDGEPGGGAAAGRTGTAAAGGRPARMRRAWPGWRRLAVPAAAVFLGVMAVVLVFELISGQSLSDTVHGRNTDSAPTLMGGGSAGEQGGADPQPQTTPAPTGGTDGGGATARPEATEQQEQQEQEQDGGPRPPGQPGTGGEQSGAETAPPQEDGTGGQEQEQQEQQEQGSEDSGAGAGAGSGGTGQGLSGQRPAS
ncbi:hypothetical protein [Streptomonospora sediminis]